MRSIITTGAVLAMAGLASAATLDGVIAMGEYGSAVAVQDTATGFGDNNSELNAAYGSLDGGTLNLAITGNLEANFNKMFIFFDAVDGGENALAGDNADGGFGEINNLNTTFDAGFTADHGIRLEVGGGFWGVNAFDLIDNTAGSIASGGGAGDLPLSNVMGGFGTSFGWDNSNTAGVTDVDASGALTATTGWEFSIDMAAFFGEVPSEVKVSVFITSGDAGFASNQVLGGVGGLGNLGGTQDFSAIAGDQFFTLVPAPGAAALLGLAGLAGVRRRR